jgi:hypothetical protein
VQQAAIRLAELLILFHNETGFTAALCRLEGNIGNGRPRE